MKDDFFKFIDVDGKKKLEKKYKYSYKMVFMLSFLKIVDNNGEVDLDSLISEYTDFYEYRKEKNLKIDNDESNIAKDGFIDDHEKVKKNILKNPFKTFEKRGFMYFNKNSNKIYFEEILWKQINNEIDLQKIKKNYFDDLVNYYKKIDTFGIEEYGEKYWAINI